MIKDQEEPTQREVATRSMVKDQEREKRSPRDKESF